MSISLLALSLFPLSHLASAYVQRDEVFPVIIDFQAGWAKSFLRFNQTLVTQVEASELLASGVNIADKRHVSQLTITPGSYPGVSVIEPYPDWSAYKTLRLEIHSSQAQAFDLVLRIHDGLHNNDYSDRFNRPLKLMPGRNMFRIPLDEIQRAPAARDMDMRQIAGIMLFAVDLDSPVKFYPITLRLE